jgi:capsular polysaccharide biosynthesis protein
MARWFGGPARRLVKALRRRDPLLERLAERAEWDLDHATRVFLVDLESCLQAPAPQRVAVLAGAAGSAVSDLLGGHPAVAETHTFNVDRPDLHVAMTARAPFDVIVDDSRREKGRAELFRNTFLHLRPGGALLVRNALAGAPRADEPSEEHLADLLGVLARSRLARPAPAGWGPASDHRLAVALDRLTIRGRHVLATNGVAARAKLREEEADAYLDLRGETSGRRITSRPAAELGSRATVRESASPQAGLLPTAYLAPELSLRSYAWVTCAPGQVVWQDNALLPDSFRHNQRAHLSNRQVRTLAPLFVRTPRPSAPAQRLEGAYFYLDSEFRGHFGHAMTEQLSRLWAWKEAKSAEPGLKALLLNKNRELAQFELDLYGAAGIDPEDVVFTDRTVRVERLLASTPMFSQPDYVHPGVAEVWREVSDNLAARAPERDYPRRFFCARRGTKRPCRNAAEVERLFADHGFQVLYPEDYSLPEQARLFRDADVIGGFAGSALFNVCLSVTPKQLVMISSESYTAQNEYMMSAVLGHHLHIAWCTPEVPRTHAGFDRASFHSAFTVDMAREGAWLRELLGRL